MKPGLLGEKKIKVYNPIGLPRDLGYDVSYYVLTELRTYGFARKSGPLSEFLPPAASSRILPG